MRRRHRLTLFGAVTGEGCLSLGRSSPLVLGKISVHNHAYEPHTVHVLVERDGRPVYWVDHEAMPGCEIGFGGVIVPCA